MSRRKRTRLAGLSAMAAMGLLALPGAASAAVTSNVDAAGKLTVSSNAGDPITITCVAGKVQVNAAAIGGDPNCSAITAIQVNGGPQANAITLTGVDATAFPAVVAPVNVSGGNGDDTVLGSQFADTVRGGGGNDRIEGDNNPLNTRDQSLGEGGNDTMVWNPGDDDDLNEGGAGSDTSEVNGGGDEQFTIAPSATPGRVSFDRTGPSPTPGPFNVDIGTTERLDFNAGNGVDTLTTTGAPAIALDIDGGEGDDVLEGGDNADLIRGGGGNDRIEGDNNPLGTRDSSLGEAGDDTMVWNPGDDDDTNEGGDGNDTVEVNGGGVDEDFRVKPSSTPGRVAFDRIGPSPTPGPFSIDIGTSEHLVLNAGAGNDTLFGSKGLAQLIKSTLNGDDGNDRIKGTDGEDLLSGGAGKDLVRSRDRAEDRVECGDGFDLAFVDDRDLVRGCDLVLGGFLRVKHSAKSVSLAGSTAGLKLKCTTGSCKGKVHLVYKGKSIGSKSYKLKGKKAKTVQVKLGKRGMRLLNNASQKGLKVQLRIDAEDSKGNGWRTSDPLRLKL